MSAAPDEQKSREVRAMFDSIATRYDFLNHFLSANIDQKWRATCVREIERRLETTQPRILDVGCGTADLSLAISRLGSVVGCDFSRRMLAVGRKKVSGRESAVTLLEADALRLPFMDESFDVAVSAFVIRNLADVSTGILEMGRVLRPGGLLGILDFSMPKIPILGSLYRFYFQRILPRFGRWISGEEGPYRYLPESVEAFPQPSVIRGIVEQSGFQNAEYKLLTGGIAVLYLAERSTES